MDKEFRNGSALQHEPRQIGEIFRNDYLRSDEPFARCLIRLRGVVYPNTEPGVDLKMLTFTPGRMGIGEPKKGVLVKDDDFHYRFEETD